MQDDGGDLAHNDDEDDDEDDDPLLPNLRAKRQDKRTDKEGVLGRTTLSREKLLAKTKANMKRKAERGVAMQARCHGVAFALDALADDRERRLFAPLCAVVVASAPGPIQTVAEPWQPRAKSSKEKKRAREEGQVEERVSKKRAVEPLTPDVERAILLAAHGTTGVEKVATELALKFVELSKKRAVQTIKEHSTYEKREGGGLRKRYYVKPETAARLGIEAAALDAALRAALEREAHEARQSATHAQQHAAHEQSSAPRRVVPVALPSTPLSSAVPPMMSVPTPNSMPAMMGVIRSFIVPQFWSQMVTVPSQQFNNSQVLPEHASPGAPLPTPPPHADGSEQPTLLSPPPTTEKKVASITNFFPLAKSAPDA